jgi:leucyl aminopeptidase
MKGMKIGVTTKSSVETSILFLTKETNPGIVDFDAKKNEITVRYDKKTTLIYCGLGESKEITHETIRSGAACAIRKAIELKRKKVSVMAPDAVKKDAALGIALVEGAILGAYSFSKYKSEKQETIERMELVSTTITRQDVRAVEDRCSCVFLARDLVNENAETVHPSRLADEARKISSRTSGITCTVLLEKEIGKQGLGLLKAVGQGSNTPPRLIILEYKGDPRSKEKTGIIGKGITFDSGGLNLKTSGHIETMRQDMAGAAAVLGIFKALSMVKPKVNVVGVIPAAQSAISATSFFPGDIYKSYSGKTVEICNTDAEGRLILADALSYCQKKYAPTELIDLATLTGAIITALGDTMAGLFCDNDTLAENLLQASDACSEHLWRMPLNESHIEAMKGDLADLRNLSKLPRGHAGSITGAAFIKSFVEKATPFAHLDIAGTAFNEREERGEVPKYATGFGVRLLMAYLTRKRVSAK